MSDDEPDLELLALLRQHLQGKLTLDDAPETGVLESAEYVYDNAIDVAIDMRSCKNAAAAIHAQMRQKEYSPATWSAHELHPDRFLIGDDAAVAFVFTMDLLNFSFWSEKPDADRFAVEYRGKRWTGYWSLVAALQRALDEGGFPAAVGFPRPVCVCCSLQSHVCPAVCVQYFHRRQRLDRNVNWNRGSRHPHHGLALLAG
jgi:hypothetical protein